MLRQERFHAERYFFTLFLHPTQELKTIWNRLQNLKYSGPVHTWPISKLMTSLRPFLASSKGWFCPRCLWCPRRVSQSHRPRTAARSKCWARWFSLLCQTCLSQTQLIPIKLISTNSSISNLSVPNLLSIPSLSLDWPSEILLALTLGHGGSRSSLVGQAQRFVPRLVCSCRFVLGRFGPRPPL